MNSELNFSSFLAIHGIENRCSCPYTLEQNGRIERKMRHIIETDLALLTNAPLPLKLWLYALYTTIFLINHLSTKVLHLQSPFQVLFGKIPNYHHLKVFGCLCYPYIHPYNKHKLSYHSIQCIFLSYSPNHKGYLCFDPLSSRIYITRHTILSTFISSPQHTNHCTNPTSSLPDLIQVSFTDPISNNTSTCGPPIVNHHPMVTRAKDGIIK